jgi:hypothetical protein
MGQTGLGDSNRSNAANPLAGQVDDLQELAAGLKALHHALLDEQRKEYERLEGPIAGGAHLLHLVTHDPFFAWLRSLSALMVDLDALLDEPQPPLPEETDAIRQELEEMFSASARAPFWDKVTPLLQTPSVVMAYARVRAVLSRLPGPSDQAADAAADFALDLHARHRWAVARRKRGVP